MTLPRKYIRRALDRQDLSRHDGSSVRMPRLTALMGIVFDVTDDQGAFGADAPFAHCVGKDATDVLLLEVLHAAGRVRTLCVEQRCHVVGGTWRGR
jgi:hypothetical protein